MKINLILRLAAVLFVSVTAVLLILTVANIIDSSETRDAIIKLAAISGIIAAAAMILSFLGDKKP
jgi:hypothetical protein